MLNKPKTIDFTEGPFAKKIIRFVIPLMLAYLFQQMYNSADLIFSGNYIGKEASAAIGASSMLITLAIGLFGGLSVGMGILFSKAYGAHDFASQNKLGKLVIILSISVGGIFTVLGLCLATPVLSLMQTPQDILEMASSYIRVYFLGIIPMVLFNMSAGLLRATGNSRTPMIFQTIGGAINVFLDWLFISTWPDGILGVAAASVISQTFAAIATYLYYLHAKKKHYMTHRELGDLADWKKEDYDVPASMRGMVQAIFALGLPVGIQNMMVTLSNVFVQANINSLGVDAIAAYTDYYKIELFLYYPIISFGQAVLFIVGQNLGAQKYDRISESIKTVLKISLPFVAVIEVLLFIFCGIFYVIFSPQQEVVELGKQITRLTTPFYFFYVFIEVFSNASRSLGKTKSAMLVSVICFAVIRAGVLVILNVTGTLNIYTVAAIYPATWGLAGIWYFIIWKRASKDIGKSKKIAFENIDENDTLENNNGKI